MEKSNLKINILVNILMLLSVFILTIYLTSIDFLISFILILIPGFVLAKLLWKTGFIETMIASVAVGLTSIAAITYLLKLLSLPLNSISLLLILSFFSIVFLKISSKDWKKIFETKISYTTIILIFILILGLATRLYPIKNSYSIPFSDAIVEGTITKLIVDNQGIPSTWQPLLPIELKHQPGLASVTAWMQILSGISIPKIILLITNLLYALLPLAVYLFAHKLLKNQTQAIVASIITLVASLPTITFIAGMNSTIAMYFLIPVSLALAIDLLDKMDKKKLFLIFLFFFGSLLIHPLFIFFFTLFILPYVLIQKNIRTFFKKTASIFVCLIIAVLAVLPYYSINSQKNLEEEWLFQRELINNKPSALFFIEPFFILFENPNGLWSVQIDKMMIDHFTSYFFTFAFVAMFFYSLYIIIRKKNRLGYVSIAWFVLFLSFSTLQNYFQIHFPLWQYIYPTRVLFLIFLPVSILLSFPFSNLKLNRLKDMAKISSPAFLCMLVIAFYIPIGLSNITNYLTTVSKQSPIDDNVAQAMSWLDENVPKKSVILNFVSYVEAGAFVGDGGQWIPAVTGRTVVFPATSVTDDVNNKTVRCRLKIMDYVNRNDTNSSEFISLAKSYNVSHIFISRLQSNYRRTFNQVSPDIFNNNYYTLLFNNSEVFIYKTKY